MLVSPKAKLLVRFSRMSILMITSTWFHKLDIYGSLIVAITLSNSWLHNSNNKLFTHHLMGTTTARCIRTKQKQSSRPRDPVTPSTALNSKGNDSSTEKGIPGVYFFKSIHIYRPRKGETERINHNTAYMRLISHLLDNRIVPCSTIHKFMTGFRIVSTAHVEQTQGNGSPICVQNLQH